MTRRPARRLLTHTRPAGRVSPETTATFKTTESVTYVFAVLGVLTDSRSLYGTPWQGG